MKRLLFCLLHALHCGFGLTGRRNRSRKAVGLFQDDDRLLDRVRRRNDACSFEFTVYGRNGSVDLLMTCAFRKRCTGGKTKDSGDNEN
ncbi:hypothetical protein D3C78_1793320 [compost metagenome]